MTYLLHQDYHLDQISLVSFMNLDEAQINAVRQWRNTPEIRQWLYNQHEISQTEHLKFIRNLAHDQKNGYWLVKENQDSIGVISLNRIHLLHQHAYLGIYANPYSHLKNKGKNCLKALIFLAFEIFKLNGLRLEVFKENQIAINLYKKMGFEIEGCLRDYAIFQQQYQDVIIMSKLNSMQNHPIERDGLF